MIYLFICIVIKYKITRNKSFIKINILLIKNSKSLLYITKQTNRQTNTRISHVQYSIHTPTPIPNRIHLTRLNIGLIILQIQTIDTYTAILSQ